MELAEEDERAHHQLHARNDLTVLPSATATAMLQKVEIEDRNYRPTQGVSMALLAMHLGGSDNTSEKSKRAAGDVARGSESAINIDHYSLKTVTNQILNQ